jgi:cardiolipin-specific phospholipase
MVFSWLQSAATAAAQTATKLERMKNAEQRLLEFARAYAHHHPSSSAASGIRHRTTTQPKDDSWLDIRTFDTRIPRSALPLKSKKNGDEDENELTIHGVHVQSRKDDQVTTAKTMTSTPLVLLHGYMNAGAYFYRNFGGLARYFQNIYALDTLGWGLSSRPSMDELAVDNQTNSKQQRQSVDIAEDWFVESLEAWRSANNIDKMILCGHSFGGYMSVAYTERYPERVERLLLLSPVGVPDETDPSVHERRKRFQSSWRGRIFVNIFEMVFEGTTVGTILRNYMSEERSHGMAQNYVTRRLPEISDPDESKTVADYLYYNSVLPGSGEYFVHNILNGMVMARRPLQFRIPNLRVDSVTFLYGSTDWMDISGGLNTQTTCEAINQQNIGDSQSSAPSVKVYMVPEAGHLLMLQNWQGTNNVIIHASGGTVPQTETLPKLLKPTNIGQNEVEQEVDNLQNFWVQKTLQSRQREEIMSQTLETN